MKVEGWKITLMSGGDWRKDDLSNAKAQCTREGWKIVSNLLSEILERWQREGLLNLSWAQVVGCWQSWDGREPAMTLANLLSRANAQGSKPYSSSKDPRDWRTRMTFPKLMRVQGGLPLMEQDGWKPNPKCWVFWERSTAVKVRLDMFGVGKGDADFKDSPGKM
jgi:hypothetical protein